MSSMNEGFEVWMQAEGNTGGAVTGEVLDKLRLQFLLDNCLGHFDYPFLKTEKIGSLKYQISPLL